MNIKDIKKIKDMDMAGLQKSVVELREEIAKSKVSQAINPIKDTNLVAKKKKTLAIVKTLIKSKTAELPIK